MKAVRLHECLKKDPSEIETAFSHLQHMYTGRLSSYYYARFDYALEQAQLSKADSVLMLGGGTGVFALSVAPICSSLVTE